VTWELVLQCLVDSMVCTDQQSISLRTMTTRASKAWHSNEHLHVIPQKKGSQISRRLIPRRFLSRCQSEEDFNQLTVLGEPFDEGNSNTARERPQLTVIALNKGLQMVFDLVDYFLEVNNFMDRCLIFKHTMEVVIPTFKEVYMDMDKKAKQPNITPIFAKSPVSNSAIQSASLDHLDSICQGTP